jgi:hypothetical protein
MGGVEQQSCRNVSMCRGEEVNENFTSALPTLGVRWQVRWCMWARSETIDGRMEMVGGSNGHGPMKAVTGA